MIERALGLALILMSCACSRLPLRADTQAEALRRLEPTERLIVAAIDNHAGAFLARAGGTPRGYDALTAYGPSASALRTMAALARDYGLRQVTAWPIEPLKLHCAVLELAPGVDRDAMLGRLALDPRVKLVEPLQSFATRTLPMPSPPQATPGPHPAAYNDPYIGLQRGFLQMHVASAHTWSAGTGVMIAIIDTGVDVQHPDLRGRIALTRNFVDDDAAQFQRDRHGTEIAGVIAAVANNHEGIVGIAPQSRLAVFKACRQVRPDADEADCNSFTLARALVAAIDAHAQVVNLSLAGPVDPLLRELIEEGSRRGIVFVGAAARDTAGLMDQREILQVESSERSAATGGVESPVLQAPGREILTLLPGGRYDFASGDSIATAEVSGVIALVLSAAPGSTAAAVRQWLLATSRGTNAAAIPRGGESIEPGVDACAAVAVAAGHGGCAEDIERRVASH